MHCCRCLFQENRKLHREYDRYIEVLKNTEVTEITPHCAKVGCHLEGGERGGRYHTSPSPAVGSAPTPWLGDSLGGWGGNHNIGGGEGNVPPPQPRTFRRGTAEVTEPLGHSHGANSPAPQFVPAHPVAVRTGQAEISPRPSALVPPTPTPAPQGGGHKGTWSWGQRGATTGAAPEDPREEAVERGWGGQGSSFGDNRVTPVPGPQGH